MHTNSDHYSDSGQCTPVFTSDLCVVCQSQFITSSLNFLRLVQNLTSIMIVVVTQTSGILNHIKHLGELIGHWSPLSFENSIISVDKTTYP